MRPESLSTTQARRIALAAQGFLDPPHAEPTMRTLQRTVDRTGVLQVDSVNVLQRAHFMPLYSRMGAYDVDLLRRASQQRPRRLVEYWAHVQALMPVELWPVMQHRMDRYRSERGKWAFVASDSELEPRVLGEIHDRGPATARDVASRVEDAGPRIKDNWGWNWSETRKVLDYLYMSGQIAIAGRNSQFEVLYDAPERVIPAAILALPIPSKDDATDELMRRAAVSLGVGTATDLRDYYRLPAADVAPSVQRLVEAGELVPVTVPGRSKPSYLHRDARIPRRIGARALLSPFDPVVWERDRTEALFDFRYRIEIYVPEHLRVHGYYVLPFLLGDELVARADLKADRKSGRLLVQAAHAEPGAPADVAEELSAELRRLADWLGLDEVSVVPRGDLAPFLRT